MMFGNISTVQQIPAVWNSSDVLFSLTSCHYYLILINTPSETGFQCSNHFKSLQVLASKTAISLVQPVAKVPITGAVTVVMLQPETFSSKQCHEGQD